VCQAGDRVLSSLYDSELCPKSGFVQRQERQYRKQRQRLGQDYYWLESGYANSRYDHSSRYFFLRGKRKPTLWLASDCLAQNDWNENKGLRPIDRGRKEIR
jgi:hypothetical protein